MSVVSFGERHDEVVDRCFAAYLVERFVCDGGFVDSEENVFAECAWIMSGYVSKSAALCFFLVNRLCCLRARTLEQARLLRHQREVAAVYVDVVGGNVLAVA